jgi:predicted dehydrogenase
MEKVKAGIVGSGSISNSYIEGARVFPVLDICACSDIIPEASEAKAREHGIRSMGVEELMGYEGIDVILNLTTPLSHREISLRALGAGKHVYSEKPLGVTLEEGAEIISLAREKGLLAGCAPDIFLGSGIQTACKVLEDGWIGEPVAGAAFALRPGLNKEFFYKRGAGPMLDTSPYYISALIAMLGPVKSVSALCSKLRQKRTIITNNTGEEITVDVPTHCSGTVNFQNGAVVTMIMSFEIWGTEHTFNTLEVYGTEGSLNVDPNDFSGEVKVQKKRGSWVVMPHVHDQKFGRSAGLADMAYAIRGDRDYFRCCAELAYHVLEVMLAFEASSMESGKTVDIKSSCPKPEPLKMGVVPGSFE